MAVADQVDVLIVTARRDEMEAAKAVASVAWPGWSGVSRWDARDAGLSVPYWWGQCRNAHGRTLSMALARPTGTGGRLTAPLTTSLVERLQPSCLAMSGVCAGNPDSTAIGDVVVASLAYEWDEGAYSANGFDGDHRQLPMNSQWQWVAEEFDPSELPSFGAASEEESMWWLLERLYQGQNPREHPARSRYFPPGTWVARLRRIEDEGRIVRGSDGMVQLTQSGADLIRRRVYDDVDGPEQLPLSVIVGPMASGSAVMSDGGIWAGLQKMGLRTIAAVDLEAATIATIAHGRDIPWLVVKGVLNHAGSGTEDRYRSFTARASAEVLFTLLARVAAVEQPVPRPRSVTLEPWAVRLLRAQIEDAHRHRYRFYGGHAPALPKLYVEQRGELPAGKAQLHMPGVLTVAQMLSRFNDVLVISDPGMGKSTMIALIQYEQARWWQGAPRVDQPAQAPYGPVVPIALPATMLVGRSLEQAMSEVCRRLGAEHEIDDLDASLPAAAAAWLIMIDGLDEVLESADRSRILTQIAYWIGQADPRRRFVVTSRPLMFTELAELRRLRIGEFALRPFEEADVATFARNWFVATSPDDAVDGLVAEFLSRVSTPQLRAVMKVPLLATIAALFFDNHREQPLPTSRTELYGWFVKHLVHGRPESREQRQRVEVEFARYGEVGQRAGEWLSQSTDKLLEHLAAGYLERDPEPLVARAERWVRESTVEPGLVSVPGWEGHLRTLLTSTAALVERGRDLEFAYHSIAEYFAAGPRAKNFDEGRWFADIRDPSRRHFAIFVLARSVQTIEPIVETLLASGGADVVAAGDIVVDGLIGVSTTVARRVVRTLFAHLEAEDPDAPEAARVLVELSSDPAIATDLEALIDNPATRPWVRAYVADAFDEIGTGTGRLRRIATQPEVPTDVRLWAAHRIRRRDPDGAADLMRDLDELSIRQADVAATSVLAQFAYRREVVDSPDGATRLTFALRLVESGDRVGRDALRDCVVDVDLRIDLRFRAARSCRDGDRGGVNFLHKVVVDDRRDRDSRAAAALALAENGDDVGVRLLRELVEAAPDLADRLPAIRSVLDRLQEPQTGAVASMLLTRARTETGKLPQVWGDLPPRNPLFTGREELLAQLHEGLHISSLTTDGVQSLLGMGGVGKSQVAIEFVHRHRDEFDLVWWVPSEQPGLVLSSLTSLAQKLDLDAGPEANTAVPAVREALSTGQTPYANWLLIFDNAEDVNEVRRFFPTGGDGKIIITSRNRAWAGITRSIEVDVFSREESIAFLRTRTPELSVGDAGRLANALGDLPLAIELAAAWYAATGMPVDEYLALLEATNIELPEGTVSPDYGRSVAAVWNMSLHKLGETNLAALQLLQVCSFFAPEPISRELFAGSPIASITPELDTMLSDPILLARAIRDIQRYALARFDHRNATLQIHRLVQKVLVGRMDEGEREVMRNGAHTLLASGDPLQPARRSRWYRYQSLLPHVQVSRAVESGEPRVQDLVFRMVEFLYHWGDHEGCERLAAEAYSVRLEQLGEPHPQTLRLAKYLGYIQWVLGKYDKSEPLLWRALELSLECFGEEDDGALDAMAIVAANLRAKGDFVGAREQDERALRISRRQFGPDDPVALNAAHNLGVSLRLTGEFRRAAELDADTHRRRVLVFGPDAEPTLRTLNGLVIDQREAGDYLGAHIRQEVVHRQCLAATEGERSPLVMLTARNLAVSRRKAGDHEGARTLAEATMGRLRRRYGDNYPDTIAAAVNLAVDLRHANKLEDARDLGESTLDRYRNLFGPSHLHTLSAQANLAVVRRMLGEAATAYEINNETLDGLVETVGADHPVTLTCATNIASDLFALGDPEGAFERDTDTLARSERSLGVDHPSTLAVAVNLALDLRELGREQDAGRIHGDVVANYQRVLGDQHPASLNARKGMRANCDVDPMPI